MACIEADNEQRRKNGFPFTCQREQSAVYVLRNREAGFVEQFPEPPQYGYERRDAEVLPSAARGCELSYSRFIAGLRRADVALNRKSLAEIAVADPTAFRAVAEVARPARS